MKKVIIATLGKLSSIRNKENISKKAVEIKDQASTFFAFQRSAAAPRKNFPIEYPIVIIPAQVPNNRYEPAPVHSLETTAELIVSLII